MIYTCEDCEKKFSQKSHYDSHKNRKIPCKKKCDKNFITQYVANLLLLTMPLTCAAVCEYSHTEK